MGALTVDHMAASGHEWDDLVRIWQETDAPEGCKVEITSRSNAINDRMKKTAGCAQAGVPLYLLIDGWAPAGPTITFYGEPHGDVYRVLRAGKFGEPILLPEPFHLELETDEFPTG